MQNQHLAILDQTISSSLMYNIVKIDSNFPIEKLVEFCLQAKNDTLPGSSNLDTEDWENKSHTLLYLIYKEKRYDGYLSSYIGLCLDNELIAGAGYYPLDEDVNIANVNSRYYTVPKYRNNVFQGTYIFPKIIEEVSQKYKAALMSYNGYNMWLRTALIRINQNKAAFFGRKTPVEYKGWNEISIPLLIKNTPQWCFYKLFDNSYQNQLLENIKKIQCVNEDLLTVS